MKWNISTVGKTALLLCFVIIAVFLYYKGPIEQNLKYHQFSDDDTMIGIPNFWNVISNLPFILIGVLGLSAIKKSKLNLVHAIFLYTGILLIGFGSGYYHLNPNNETLIWDRLPMTICFMTLFSVLLADYLYVRKKNTLLLGLLTIGLYSIGHWVFLDDLRVYILVQFFPMVCIPIILLTQKSVGISSKAFWVLLAWYGLAKGAESFDIQVHLALDIISGHSLKHLFAAIGLYQFYKFTTRENLVVQV